ncbi:MAG: GntR family transcriptional regulator, partial [Acidimicrobiales bacterium]
MTGTVKLPSSDQSVPSVHRQLRQAILRGELAAGRVVPQLELASELGVGRTPLREALRLLQQEGLVVLQPNRRVQIAPLSIEDVEELYIARIALESVAVHVTVPTFRHEDIAELEGLMAQMDHLAGTAAGSVTAPHDAFHSRFVALAGTRPTQLIAELADQAGRYRRVYGGSLPERWPQRQAEHRAILDAAKAGDSAGVAEAIAHHYLGTARIVAAALDPDHRLHRLEAGFEALIGKPTHDGRTSLGQSTHLESTRPPSTAPAWRLATVHDEDHLAQLAASGEPLV